MAPNAAFRERLDPAENRDPREGEGAEVIDLATRNVLPTVTQRKKADGLGLAAGVLIVAALGGVTLWSMDAARTGPANNAPAPAAPQAAPVPAGVVAAPAAPGRAAAPAPLAAPAPQPVLAAPPQSLVATAPASNPHASPTVVFDAGGNPVAIAAPGASADGKGAGNPNDDFASRIGGVGGGAATASRSFDPATTVTQGTLIPAVLETAIDTDVPGYVRAIVSTDVRSFDGKRVLVPRSSRLIGQYKSGLTAGQKRAYVIWTRLIRPDGVSVNIGSPAIAFGGETGLPGKVNSHFFERFGSAMLLSVVGGLSTITGNAGVVIAGGGQSAAAAAVQQGGQVGPTIRVRQGEPIRVFTAKDLDFSKVS
ncbi:TrbI/VirB10 family protein [Novosphingobium album (ex Liu et al. 2023)]|uniref:TrbI/VirB10 family protein n=1 Tax=Novosphingobium album (ex Liu et al. 2023) TaxID=3031130 RepID=A0ABT5WLF1_9SPHN|nr:TrbI/VirB10 family protein [Novosphingobium album (ex Liu et al. 2023)]MDE8650142.1 TrbI/VirB10 family protein [Novosphingobium album (ex Liu et al. 2023)]